jgi:putative ABC transport system permease protein
VFGASLSRSATSSVDNAISADLIVTNTSTAGGSGGFSTTVPLQAARVPGVTATSTVYGGQFEFRNSLESILGLGTENLSKTVILNMTAGNSGALATGGLLVDTSTANSDHLTVGETVPVKFALTGRTTMRIGGIYQPNALAGKYLVSDTFFLAHFQNPLPGAVLINTDRAGVQQSVARVLKAYPNVQVQSRAQFEASQAKQVNQLLGLVYALLALAVLIALIGIVNTLMLSVFERTHEIGLLRAVGMRRRQIRAMIRSESVILAVFGAVIGIIVGTALGLALVSALHSQGVTSTVVPYSSLVVFLILSALLGLLAASWPARRAAKLDILAAIAAD